jgi:signal transduction histidine kinase
VVATAVIGSDTRRDGEVVLVRDAEPLHHRIATLWLALAIAALATVALSVVAAMLLARWIGRPLRGLENTAARMGRGEVSARTDTTSGPPEVRNLSSTFNEMAQRIASLLEGQRAITADVSHQLRTPLAALRLRLELLAEDAPDDVASELLGALGEIARLNRLLDGLLAVARAEEAPSEPEAVDTAALLNGRLDLWQPVAADKSVTLTTSTADAWVLATPGHLEQILDNLIANSLDALQSGGHVDVSATTEDGCVVLAVCDDGPGMTMKSRESAFTRFDTDRAGRNAGLGLAIVARLVASDHGTIALGETPGGGLSAVIKLPSAGTPPDWAGAERHR